LQVNKQSFPVQPDENGFISIDRTWMDGDLVKLSLPMTLRAESLPDGSPWISFVKGPIVLAARIADSDSLPDLHRKNSRSDMLPAGALFPQRKVPIVIQNNKPVTTQLRPIKGQPLAYSASFFTVAPTAGELMLTPLYALHDARYFVYWRLATPAQLDSILRTWETEDQLKRLLERKTIDKITPGNVQDEQEHAFRDDESFSGWRFERSFRAAQNGFGYLISNASLKGKILRLTLEGKVKYPGFDVWIDDARVKTIEPDGQALDDLIDIDLTIPDHKHYIPTFRIRFTSKNTNGVPPIFHIRLLSE
jgi:hypothetical protein